MTAPARTEFDTAAVRRLLARSNQPAPTGALPDPEQEAQALAIAADTDLTLQEARHAVTYLHDVLLPTFQRLSSAVGQAMQKMAIALAPLGQAANRAAAALAEPPAARAPWDDEPREMRFVDDGDHAILTITTGPEPTMTLDADVTIQTVSSFGAGAICATLTSPNVRGELVLCRDSIVASDRLPAIPLLAAVRYLEPHAGTPVPVADVLDAINRAST